ncbi:MAG: hypothetical protein LUH00_13660 [Lachnospiraceae bacterium]|nr:hypothetical protein [Lachnospiraceae bacterium]
MKEANEEKQKNQKNDSENNSSSSRRRAKYSSFLIPLLIIIFYTIYQFAGGGEETNFVWSDTSVTVICPDEEEFTVNYADVTSLDLISDADYGICISGKDSGSKYYGTWENDLWGTYSLCIFTSISNCIVIHANDSVLVFNYESASITESLFEEIQKYCENSDYPSSAYIGIF